MTQLSIQSILSIPSITKSEFSAYIKSFQFREIFNEMGWNNERVTKKFHESFKKEHTTKQKMI
jgi:hypothetical protein